MADLPNLQINGNAVSAPRLPYVPTPRVATLERAQPTLMTPQLAELPSPLRDVSNALSKASDETNDVAKLFAKQAGLQAVTRDDQGNLVIAKAPIVGDAAVAYQAAVKYSALALGENEAKRQDLVLSRQYHNDPDGYLTAASAFQKAHVAEYAKTAGPDVAAELSRSIDNQTSINYRWLVLEQQRNIKHQFDQGTQAKLNSLETDISSLIQTGGGNTPQAKKLIDDYVHTVKARVQNPVLGESPDVGALRLKNLDLKVGSDMFVHGINTILQNPAGGVQAAQEALDSHMKETNVSPAQRLIDVAAGQKAIKDHIQNLERNANLNQKAQKLADEAQEDAIIKDSASPNPQVTENDIKNNPAMSAEAKMRMLGWLKRDGMPEPLAKVSQRNTMDLFGKMSLPEDDPAYIKDLRPIRQAYIDGQISRQDEDWLEKRFKEGQSPDGSPLKQEIDRVVKAAAFDRSTLFKKDDIGPLAQYQYAKYVQQRVDFYRQNGKDPFDLFNPSKPDFIGKPEIIDYFRGSLDDHMKAMQKGFMGARPPPPPGFTAPEGAAKPTRQPGESIADFKKRTGLQ